jgi:dienelactone hydrolase
MAWLTKGTGGKNGHTFKEVDPIVEKSIKWLKEQGYERIGSVGYCFGAKYVIRFLKEGGGIDVGFVAHPSYVIPFPILPSPLLSLLFAWKYIN